MTPMALRRWPRKNDPESIRARQEAVRSLTDDGEVLWEDLEPWTRAQESLTGVAVIPVGVVTIDVELGEYALAEADWIRRRDRQGEGERVRPPGPQRGRALGVDAARREGCGGVRRFPNVRAL